MKKLMTGLVAMVALVAVAMSATAAMDEDSIRERTKPVGTVCVEGEDCGSAAAAAPSGPRDPEELYTSVCAGCHATGALSAPKVGDVADWTARLDKGLDQVIANAINGIGAMPPKGTCATCSDEDIANAVEYMVNNSK